MAYRDTSDVADATSRLIRSVGRRVATEDVHDLEHLAQLQAALDEAWTLAVAGLRLTGNSDSAIGRELGITKQAVAQRWPRPRA